MARLVVLAVVMLLIWGGAEFVMGLAFGMRMQTPVKTLTTLGKRQNMGVVISEAAQESNPPTGEDVMEKWWQSVWWIPEKTKMLMDLLAAQLKERERLAEEGV